MPTKQPKTPKLAFTYTKEQALLEMVCWMYISDGRFPNKSDWRKVFVDKLADTIKRVK